MTEHQNQDSNLKLLSDITTYSKYAKFLPEENRRETWEEICWRNAGMHIKKYPHLKEEIEANTREFLIPKKVLASMRMAQFSGKPIELSPNRGYNCAFVSVEDYYVFPEIMFLLLGGSGVGFSVQNRHISKLPPIRKPVRSRRYLVADSIEGWADAVKILIKAYLCNGPKPNFDFSDIRKKGTPLKTSGGKAPGPQPLKDCLYKLEQILDSKENGEQLKSIEVHDMICHIADSVLAGGIRRAALISLFDMDDEDMVACKSGNWWELNPQRGRANNSAVILRHKITEEKFFELWTKIRASKSGEPGFYFTNDFDVLCNPCCEISIRSREFCNLCEINRSNIESQEDLNARSKVGTFFGTLQAGYTNFHYLKDTWRKNCEKEALLGVSGTGIASQAYLKCDLEEAAKIVKEENKRVAKLIGTNPAARLTCTKPSGTTSCVLGTSSGIHAWFDKFYIRRLEFNKIEPIYHFLMARVPELMEDHLFRPHQSAFLKIPIKAPKDAITAPEETALQLLERIKYFSQHWIKPGHVKGENTHNVSATVYIKEHEWDDVGYWMWNNREHYNGLAVLPFDGGTYTQTPFESITEEEYERLSKFLEGRDLDFREIYEDTDETNLAGEVACAGGACEIK